jgi:hypothetical protein
MQGGFFMPIDEQQLSALINAAVHEAVERTSVELSAKFEAETAGLRKNRDELLAEKKGGEGKQPEQSAPEDFDKWLAGVDERLRKFREQEDRWSGKSDTPINPPVREHTISRADARSGEAYRAAKAAAEKAGVPLRIVDENAPPQQRRSSPVKLVHDEIGGVLHANIELVERHGQQRMRQLAADKGASLRVFRSVDDLPDEAAAKHAEIIAGGDRSNLLAGE